MSTFNDRDWFLSLQVRCCFVFLFIMVSSCVSNEAKVVIDSLDQLKDSTINNLPIGTSKVVVEEYLAKLNLEHSYFKSNRTFYAIVPDIGRYRIVYTTSLLIRIILDEKEKVQRIEFELEHDGL